MSTFETIPEQSEDIPGRPIAWTLVLTVLAIATSAFVVWALDAFQLIGGGSSRATQHVELAQPAEPRATPPPPAEPFTMLPPAGGELDRWRWADRGAERVRVPIEIAIDRYVGGGR